MEDQKRIAPPLNCRAAKAAAGFLPDVYLAKNRDRRDRTHTFKAGRADLRGPEHVAIGGTESRRIDGRGSPKIRPKQAPISRNAESHTPPRKEVITGSPSSALVPKLFQP